MDASGRWHIVATTLPFWRNKQGPVAEYGVAPDGSMRDRLEWWVGTKHHELSGRDTPDGDHFVWRGTGLAALFSSRWRFVELSDTHAVTWFARATFGVTPEGMDVYGRTEDLDWRPIVQRVQADPRFVHLTGWYAPDRRRA